jgi:tRNA (guanine6-N2)-methyltransferase
MWPMLFMGTVAPGIESIAESEIQDKLAGAWIQATFRGRVLFGCTLPLQELLTLRCIDNLYAHIAWLSIGPTREDLRQLRDVLSTIDLAKALSLLPDIAPKPRVYVSASRAGKHTYSRFEAAEAVFAALREQHGFARGDLNAHDIALRLDIIDSNALLSLKLTPPTFRFRGHERGFSAAALRPPVAHALVWASVPCEDDIFLDPFCGSGTIVAERSIYSAERLMGSDISSEALDIARRNVPLQAELYDWDARNIKMASRSVSCVVTNPPWGNQISAGTDVAELYGGFLKEVKRVVVSRGRVIVLTDQVRSFEQACQALNLPCETLCHISLHGLLPSVFVVKPT